MSTIRIVYRNHLLPPVLKPYHGVMDYFWNNIFKGMDQNEIKKFWLMVNENDAKKIKKEMKKENEEIL